MRYLSIDIGTTTIKGVIYDEDGLVTQILERKSKTISERSGFMEQEPDAIITHVFEIITEALHLVRVLHYRIGFISFSCYMHSIIAVDAEGNPLTCCILWSDSRCQEYTEQYKQNGMGIRIYKNTGTPVHPMSPLYKIMYIRDNEKAVYAKAKKFVSIKAYLFQKLIGEYVVDHSIASASGMFNIHTLQWDAEALAQIGIDASKLPTPVPTTTVYDACLPAFKDYVGLDYPLKLIIGASDGCLANLGSHGLDVHTGVITIGTSGAVRIVSDKPIIDEQGRLFTYILAENFFVSGGAITNGGLVFEWFKNTFPEISDLDSYLSDYHSKANGLLFLPFLNGERAPYWNANLRGAYIGIQNNHTKKDFLFSTIQGICFAIKDVFIILQTLLSKVDTVYANGGFIKSNFWILLLSSILNKEIHILDQGDSACFGAFLLGMKASGGIASWKDCDRFFKESIVYKAESLSVYERMFELYKKSIMQNEKIMADLSDIQSESR
ncbi:putative gluconokinase [Treponema phagedenis F0421]|uniref:gluconokinase n=1 Tax=Treponema phagedenis TaxID=162 RepID=UPI0001F63FFC|nr:gluconokinase [Treponema phagedenis]EFW37086.1 putative gluconokinase [Treponema phagedenis F0421]